MPNFNFPGEKGGIFCAQHKSDGMVDIKHKRCVEPGCNKRPSFNYTGARSPARPCPSPAQPASAVLSSLRYGIPPQA